VDWWIWLGVAVVVVAVGWLAVRLGWIDLSDKTRRGKPSGSAVLMIGDEVFAPRKYEAQIEVDRQARLPVPSPVPGDGDKGIDDDHPDRFRGRIRLDIDRV
jgi:hypothetical protein